MNLKPLLNYLSRVDDAIDATGKKWITDDCTDINSAIKIVYKDIYDELHDVMVKSNGNASAAKAQENAFRQAIVLYLCRVLKVNAKIKLCTVLDEADPMKPKQGIVKSYKLYNSITVTEPTCAEYECIVQTSDFDLNVEYV